MAVQTAAGITQERRGIDAESVTPSIVIDLNAAIIAISEEQPQALIVHHGEGEGLPFGPFEPLKHRTMEIGLRRWVEEQTKLSIGYVEQLYTFGDRGRHAVPGGAEPHVVSVGYLALTRRSPLPEKSGAHWQNWYRFFPWEDWREERPALIDEIIEPLLRLWAKSAGDAAERAQRNERIALSFGLGGRAWNEEQVLERYELLYEAGLVGEAHRDRAPQSATMKETLAKRGFTTGLGAPMAFDHRRILATAMGRLRGKLEYRPLVFELMVPSFTLFELQRTVEAVSGVRIHKQNFRRLLARTGLVEPTGRYTTTTGGRPAEQFRFRRDVLRERPAPGMRLPMVRGARI